MRSERVDEDFHRRWQIRAMRRAEAMNFDHGAVVAAVHDAVLDDPVSHAR